jgi:hypothetical protein
MTIKVHDDSVEYICNSLQNRTDDIEKHQMDQHITLRELRTAIKQAPKKSPGEDGLVAELYEWGQEKVSEDLLILYNHIFHTGTIPRSMTRVYWSASQNIVTRTLLMIIDR